MPAAPTEADVIFDRASVALAKSQRLIASWLPPKTAEELANTKSEEELEREEKEIFTPVPELLGVGAPIPKDITDGTLKRREFSSNDKLLQQLIGKRAAKAHIAAKQAPKSTAQTQKNNRYPSSRANAQQDGSEDEEGGRTAAFKSKGKKAKRKLLKLESEEKVSNEADNTLADTADLKKDVESAQAPIEVSMDKKRKQVSEEDSGSEAEDAAPRKKAQKPTSFLDEVLAERAKKKKKKKGHSEPR